MAPEVERSGRSSERNRPTPHDNTESGVGDWIVHLFSIGRYSATLLAGVAVGIMVNFIWQAHVTPNLSIVYSVGTMEWSTTVTDSTIINRTRFVDLSSGELVAKGRVVAPDSVHEPVPPGRAYIIKLLISNHSKTAAHDLRIPVHFNYPGSATVQSTPNVNAGLVSEPPQVRWYDIIHVETVQPNSYFVVTYNFVLDAAVLREVSKAHPVEISIPYLTADETGAMPLPDTLGFYGSVLMAEARINPRGASMLSLHYRTTGTTGRFTAQAQPIPAYFAQIPELIVP